MSTAAQEHLSDATECLDDIAIKETKPEEFQRPYDHNDLCDSNPEFPVICSFISKFGVNIDLRLDIERLKENIENQEKLDDDLIDLHVKLLKKLRRYLNRDQWEKALIRFAYEYSYEDGYEIESLGYLKTRPSIKLSLLRRLLDAQFECDPKFKASVNAIDADELRNQPTGRDIEGNTYWHCLDPEGNIRVYRDQPLDYTAWKTVCRNPEDLKTLLRELDNSKGEIVKGEPQLEPYNPYSQIFSELFVKVENTDTPPKRQVKKGRGRHKKSSPLQTLKETVENTIIEESPSKPKSTPNQILLSKDIRPGSTSPINGVSVESQVKQTIENILTRVTSSFDFIFRRGSPEELKPKLPDEQVKKPTKLKKKREPVELPRRTSSRIQQLQQKKELEQEVSKKKRDQFEKQLNQQPDSCSRDSVVSDVKSKTRAVKDNQRWRNNKGKKKLSWDKDDSDLSSTSSLTESNDESFMEAINGDDIDENDEDEFACEDEESNDVPVIIKRARTARQSQDVDETRDPNHSTLIEEDKPCGRCDKSNDPEFILLCDMCDDGYHTTCCIPALMYVPDGDWFCPSCEHKVLIDKLTDVLSSVEAVLAIKERERAKKEKLRQARKDSTKLKPETSNRIRNNLEDDPITLPLPKLDERVSFDECLSPSYRERSYKRPKKKVFKAKQIRKRSRRWSDSDEDNNMFNRKSMKSYSRDISDSESEGNESVESSAESDEDDKPRIRKARACVSYKFQEYDELIRSAICADSDKIDAGITDHEEDDDQTDTCNVGRGKDMATIEALAYQQENGIIGANELLTNEPPESGATEKPASLKKKVRKLNDLDADSEIDIATSDESFQALSSTDEEDEDEDEDEATEVSSDEDSSIDEIVNVGNRSRSKKKRRRSPSSDDSDFLPRTRRAAARQVSYRESSEEEEELIESTKKVKKTFPSSDDETDASWKSAPETDDETKAESMPIHSSDDIVTSPQLPPSTNEVELASTLEVKEEEKVTKKIRLEKRETRPVFVPSAMNESFDEIAAPIHHTVETSTAPASKSQPAKTQPSNPRPLKAQSLKAQSSKSQSSKPQPVSVSGQLPATKLENSLRQPKTESQLASTPTQFGLPRTQPALVAQQIPMAALPPTQPMESMRSVQPMHSMAPMPHNHYPQYSQPIYQQYSHPSYYSPHPRPYHTPPQAYGLANAMPYMVRPPPMAGGLLPPHMIRSPINELNQYCAQSPYPPNIFNSFNMSMPPKNIAPPPPHPPFYTDEEMRPTPQNPGGKQKT